MVPGCAALPATRVVDGSARDGSGDPEVRAVAMTDLWLGVLLSLFTPYNSSLSQYQRCGEVFDAIKVRTSFDAINRLQDVGKVTLCRLLQPVGS